MYPGLQEVRQALKPIFVEGKLGPNKSRSALQPISPSGHLRYCSDNKTTIRDPKSIFPTENYIADHFLAA